MPELILVLGGSVVLAVAVGILGGAIFRIWRAPSRETELKVLFTFLATIGILMIIGLIVRMYLDVVLPTVLPLLSRLS